MKYFMSQQLDCGASVKLIGDLMGKVFERIFYASGWLWCVQSMKQSLALPALF